jgi:type I restriction enzyme S subunit
MKLHELFPEISLNPASAKDIKQWILQLAVEGKLTKKWREENLKTNSSDLLKKINVEKAELIKSKKIKKENFETLSDDQLIEIPKNWFWQRLGEIGFIFNGDSINATVKEQRYTNIEEGYPYVSTKDVGYGFEDIDLNNGVKIPKDEPKFKLARKNTILICAEGGSAGKKMGILTEESCFGNKLFAIHEFGGISSKFILIFYGSVFFQNEFQSRMSGIIGGISRNKFAEIPICLPPLEEQHAIVSIVESLFKEVDELAAQAKQRIELKRSYAVAALNRLCEADTAAEWQQIAKVFPEIFNDKQTIKTLRETILQLAVQGKLTAKWRSSRASLPTYQTAHELLAQIKAEKAQLIKEKKIKAEKPLPAIEADEIPFELPEGWVWCRLGEVSINLDGNRIPLSKLERTKMQGEFDYYGAQGIIDNINKYIFSKSLLLIAEDGGNLLRRSKDVAYLAHGKFWVNNHAHVVDTVDEITKYFLCFYINSIDLKPYLNGEPPMQIKLNQGKLNIIPCPIPSINEQQIIVEKVNALMGLCDELEKGVEGREKILQNI